MTSYEQIVQVMDELVRKSFREWSQSLDGQYLKRLEPVLVRCKDNTAKLDVDFDKWVAQTRLTHTRHQAFTLEYTFTQTQIDRIYITIERYNYTRHHLDTLMCS